MKVLISRKDLRDTTSGVPKKVLQELQFFKQLGHESFAIAETLNKEMVQEFGGKAVKTMRWPFSGYFRRKFYNSQVEKWVKKKKPGLVIGHGDILHQDVLFIHNCVHLAHELIEGKPLPIDHEVGKVHSAIFKEGTYKLLVCNSKMMKNDLVKRFNLDASKAAVIYPEVNLSKFEVADPEAVNKEWREKLGFKSDDFVIGLVTSGNFKKRNLGLLINAFIEVRKVYPKAKLFIAGGNIDQKYKDQAPKDCVVFAPPIIDVKNYYYLLDVFVLPALIEEFGRSVLEAMYCGKPVITTKTVGASEIFEGESKEYILPFANLENLTSLLKAMAGSAELCHRLGKLNHEVSKKYAADEQNGKFGQALKDFKIL
jgi:UDP-glucose:(heptosyl)LPS alpha-1,3-glucosyltransferase